MDFINLQKEYEWVLKVLNSSLNEVQIKTTERLFENFLNKWSKDLSEERQLTFVSNFRKYKSHRMTIVKKIW